jgi:ribonucleoside-diphosphate reductase alpha chain
MDNYQRFIHVSRYARYIPELKRRENWDETVTRLTDFIRKHQPKLGKDIDRIHSAVLKLEVMPSMRLLMSAGEACERDNIAAYNCSYLAMNNKRAFSECLYILMNGTGVGFSCERQEIEKLPTVPESVNICDDIISVADSKLGWAKAFKKLLSSLWEGDIPTIDYSRIRPAGARLKTFGGRASGPDPLERLFTFVINTFLNARGRKLNSLEVHDITCMIGEIVVVGGVRRSALISLSNLSDKRMREAKVGNWFDEDQTPWRRIANNSVAYTETPDIETFIDEWISLIKSKSGERGIFNRVASQKQAAKWKRRSESMSYGTNPCSEIILRDKQFCNLTEVVIREEDTKETLLEKVRLATILGTFQSTLDKFQFLSADWHKNTTEERLLGVSLTGIMDSKMMANPDPVFLEQMRDEARKTNEKYAKLLDVPVSAAISCIKPSGTVSQLVNASSGIHSRHSPYYIRTVRTDKKDSLYEFLKDKGVPVEDCLMDKYKQTAVFSFPIKSPRGCITRDDRTALQELETWLTYQRYWCEHKPSVTINVRDHEWLEVGAWVYKNFDEISGISFLPHSDHTYLQAPYQEVDKEAFRQAIKETPQLIEFEELIEEDDNTEGSQTLACVGSSCEIT